jgi:hypothetical protein
MSHLYPAAVLCAILISILIVPSAWGGRVIDLRTTYFDETKAEETARISCDQGRLRFDATQSGRKIALVVRVDAKGEPVCWVMDVENDTYVELTRKSVADLEAQIERARQALEEQLAAAPPEKREQMRRAVESQYGSVLGKKPKLEFKKIASGVKIDKWRCSQYESSLDDSKYEDIWTAVTAELKLTESDLELLGDLGALFSGVSQETNAFFQAGRSEKSGGFDGFPILVVEYKNGQKHEKSEVTSIRQEALDPGLFELPKGARLQKLGQ